jgi:hypothetical protein
MKNHCTARLISSTLEAPERKIGHCGDATRAPTQQPEWPEAAASASVVSFWPESGKSRGFGGGAPK